MKKSLLFLIAGSLFLTAALHGAVFQDHLDLFNKAVAAKDLATAEKHANDAIAMLQTLKPQTVVPGRCDLLLRPFLAEKDFKTVDKLYVSMICNASGDSKAILLDRYAKFLEKEKLATPEVIAKQKAARYTVSGLSPAVKFGFLVDDNRLPEAIKLAETMTLDRRTLMALITPLKKKGVYGSPYVQQLYKKVIALDLPADAKVLDIQEYATYCKDMALLNESELQKLLASRNTLPGLTDAGRFEIKLYDLASAPDNEAKIKLACEIATLAKTESQCMKLSDSLSRLKVIHLAESFEIYEKTILPTLKTPLNILRCAATYSAAGREADRYKETVAYLTDLALKTKDPSWYCALAACYETFALRYYDVQDPVLLERAMLAYQTAYETFAVGEYYARMEVLLRLVDLACRRGNRSEVENFAAMGMNMAIPESYRRKKDCESAKEILFAVPRAQAAYADDDYEAVVRILKPVIGKRQHFPGSTSPNSGNAYEMLVRSLVALGEYQEALKYTDDMIKAAPGYMRKRLEIQVNELKERAAQKD